MKKTNKSMKNNLPYLVLGLVLAFVFFILNFGGNQVHTLTTGELLKEIKNEKVSEVLVTPNRNQGVYIVEGKLAGYKENESFKAKVLDKDLETIVNYSNENDIKKYETKSDPGTSIFTQLVVNVLPFILLIALSYMVFSKITGANKSGVDFGKSRARLTSDKDKKTFKDVAGLVEEKEEVSELIDFLKNPKKF